MSSCLFTEADILAATNGKLSGEFNVTGISIDTRTIAEGDLFIAIIGENNNGHDYVAVALEKGAVAAIVSEVRDEYKDDNIIVVEDTSSALNDLAIYKRSKLNAKLIAVTGSVGKTTTKEMLNLVLSKFGKTHATMGNLNNHYGMPLSLARCPLDADFVILEMGMSGPNEIAPLSSMAKPDISLITAIEPVHIEFFDSLQGIAAAKAEIFTGLDKQGFAIINADNDYLDFIKDIASSFEITNQISFGRDESLDCFVKSNNFNNGVNEVKATIKGKNIEYDLDVVGKHQATNALSVIIICDVLNLDIDQAVKSLKEFQPAKGRGNKYVFSDNDKVTFTLIDDSYNSSPASVKASLLNIRDMKPSNGRSIAMLGDMLELGDDSVNMHQQLKYDIIENKVDLVLTVGKYMQYLYDNLPDEVKACHCDNIEELLDQVHEFIKSGDLILIKGSRGMKMEKIIEKLGDKYNAI